MDDITFVPALSYRDPKAALDWLADAFGFELTMAIDGPDGDATQGHYEMGLEGTHASAVGEWNEDAQPGCRCQSALAIGNKVHPKLPPAHRNDLRGRPRSLIQHWRSPAFGLIARHFPTHFAAVEVKCRDVRVFPLIGNQNHRVAGNDRRCAEPLHVGERAEWSFPSQLPLGIVGHKTEVFEEHIYVFPVGHRCQRRFVIQPVRYLRMRLVDGSLPQ